jgi:CHAD domain-containing protein
VSRRTPPPVEREVKLGAWPGFELPDLDGVAPWLHTGLGATRVLDAWYYDAPDLRLLRAGVTLRYRRQDDADTGTWTLKVPLGAGGPSLERFELDIAGAPTTVPAELVRVVAGMLRRVESVRVARLQTRRVVVALHDGDGRAIGEVCDDEVSVMEDELVAARFRELEVESAPGAPAALASAVVARLREAGAGEPDPTPKLARALGPRALGQPDPVVPPIDRHADSGTVVRAALAASVQRLLAHDPIVRLEAGPVGVHQARVSTRRLRSDLRTFADLVDTPWAESLRSELAWLADLLGGVRDLDVLGERLSKAVNALDASLQPDAWRLLRHIARQRRQRYDELHVAMQSDRYFDLLDRLVAAAERPHLTELAAKPAADAIVSRASAPFHRLAKAANHLGRHASNEELHRARIRTKRARYATEAVARYVPAAGRLAEAVAELQGVLGDQHDAVVAEGWLRDVVGLSVTRRQAFVAGLLAAAERVEAQRLAREWPSAWKAANRKKLRTWMHG